jgi:excisionase family DNA binding protein
MQIQNTPRRTLADTAERTALLDRPHAAAELSISLRTLDDLVARGELPVVRIGRAVRIRPTAIEYFIEARETRTKPRTRGRSRQ